MILVKQGTDMYHAKIRKYVTRQLLYILYINTMDLNLTRSTIVRVFSFKKPGLVCDLYSR